MGIAIAASIMSWDRIGQNKLSNYNPNIQWLRAKTLHDYTLVMTLNIWRIHHFQIVSEGTLPSVPHILTGTPPQVLTIRHHFSMISRISPHIFPFHLPPSQWWLKPPKKNVKIPAKSPTVPPGQEHHGSSIGHLAAVASSGAATRLEGLGWSFPRSSIWF